MRYREMTKESDRTGPTWEQFGLRHNWGKQKGNEYRNESKKAKKKRLKGTPNNTKKKKKKKKKTYHELQQLSLAGENITLQDAESFADKMETKQPNTKKNQKNWETYFSTPLKSSQKMEGADSVFGKCT